MAPTSGQSTRRRIIPTEKRNKMSRAEKREFFREQRTLARARKPKEVASGGAEITVDSSTTVNTATKAAQVPTGIMPSRQDV